MELFQSFLFVVRAHDKRIACEEEFSDSEDEGEGGRRNAASFKKAKRTKMEGEKEAEEEKKKGAFLFLTLLRFTVYIIGHLVGQSQWTLNLFLNNFLSITEVKEEEKQPEEEKMDTSK